VCYDTRNTGCAGDQKDAKLMRATRIPQTSNGNRLDPPTLSKILSLLTLEERERFRAWFEVLAPEAANVFLKLAEGKTTIWSPSYPEPSARLSLSKLVPVDVDVQPKPCGC